MIAEVVKKMLEYDEPEVGAASALLFFTMTMSVNYKCHRSVIAIALPADPRLVSHLHMYFRFTLKI